jgi:hypothetical protein
MLGNFSEQRRHNRVVSCGLAREATLPPASHRWLATALLVGASLLAARVASGRTSCPLTTTIASYAATTSPRYEIAITDGGAADLDGTVNGSCETAIKLCRGESSLCDDLTFDGGKVHASGGRNPIAREILETRVGLALASLNDSPDACNVARLALAAEEDASALAFRFRIQAHDAEGRSSLKRSRVGIRCLAATSDQPAGPECYSGRGDCPAGSPTACGDGIVDGPGEQCDGTDASSCTGSCTAACTCAEGPGSPQPPGVPACGDGARNQVTERCDGADDEACPGACRPDCTCGTESGALDVAPLAAVSASSSAAGSSPVAAIDQVIDGVPGYAAHEWVSNGEGYGAWLRLEWDNPVEIESVILHDRPNGVDNVTEAALLADDDGAPISTGALSPDGASTEVMIGPRTITALTFMVMQSTGSHAGLAEIEAVKVKRRATTTTSTTTLPTTTAPSTSTTTTPPTTLPPASTTTTPPTTAPSTSTPTTVAPTTTSSSSTTAAPPTTTTSTTLPSSSGPTYYLAPSGSDSNSGTSPDAPWKSFTKVKSLQPGDTLVVLDGTYGRGTTGLPVIDCANGAHNGTASQPITIRAANERRAWLKSDGVDALYMNKCSYWNIIGFRASSADNSGVKEWEGNVMRFYQVDHVNVRRVLAYRPNRTCPNSSLSYCNVHAIAIEKSHHVLVEDSEIYDFHRHGVSAFSSRFVTVRRCYMNPWDATGGAGGGSTGVIFYGSSDSIVENVVGEGVYGLNIAGGTTYDGLPGGYRNKLLGVVTLNAKHGSTIRARKFSGPVLPAGHNLIKDSVFIHAQNVGVFARGVTDTEIENVSVFDTIVDAGVMGDQDLSEGAPCSANPEGCSISARNLLSIGNTGKGMAVDTGIMESWSLTDSNLYGNKGGNFPTGETPGDDSGNIRRSQSTAPIGMGRGTGKCMLWVPDGSNMKGAGAGGEDIGATVLNRYVGGVLTTERLWDPATGAFPCGATVAGVNDDPARSCIGVHARLNVNTNGCSFPAGY